jgi:hypothetical protein
VSGAEVLHVQVERTPFVMLPRWLLRHEGVGEGAKVLYCVLHDMVAGREGPTRPVTRAELAGACGVSANTVDRRLAELIDARAVEKEALIVPGGQVGNVYRVWLTPPEARGVPVDNRVPRNGDPPQGWVPPLPKSGDPSKEEPERTIPPIPPRGGQVSSGGVGRRRDGTNPRSLGANPRAETASGEAEQAGLEADRHAAAIDAEVATRRREAEEAAAARARAEAEAAAASAALDDDLLHRLLARCRDGLPGPLACSAAGVTRAAVSWCRGAVGEWPGDLATAVRQSLDSDWPGPAGVPAPPLCAGPPPPDAEPLVERIRLWLEAARPGE